MRARPNRKRKPKQRKKNSGIPRTKAFTVSMLLGAVAAIGFWRCFDDGNGDPFEPLSRETALPKLAMENGQIIDPTLLNEQQLLKEEIPEKKRDENLLAEPAKPADVNAGDPTAQPIEEENPQGPDAPEERFPLFAVAYHFHTQVRSLPEGDSAVVGYARRGATFRVGRQLSKKGCLRGWHEVAPGNLFVCAGEGIMVSSEPVTFAPSPPAPNMEASLPYKYAYVNMDNTPQYWRIPTSEELEELSTLFERIDAKEKRVDAKRTGTRAGLEEALDNADRIDRTVDGGMAAAHPLNSSARPDDGGAPDPFALPQFVHQRMNKGYFVSVDGDEEGPEKYTRTIRGRYIAASRLNPADPPTFEGMLLGEIPLPRVFVVGGGVKLLAQKQQGSALEKTGRALARLSNLPCFGELKRRARTYLQVGDNQYLSSSVAVLVKKAVSPEDLKPGERWIDIDLSKQSLVAYEEETPVFATLVSSGRKGFETPQGTFRISSKHVSITMDDPNAGDEAYLIEDVPWTQYFEEGYALHAAFWHNRFGRVRSHGCINLSPADARRLFFWTEPHLPTGFHGVIATRNKPGTRVVIHE
jgi:lipoprotein-anchoring transpeptidase ErfK/SrfK